MSKKNLSIVIPTFNRHDVLIKNYQRLIKFGENYLFNIIILDNNSPVPVIEAFKSKRIILNKNTRIIRNKTNIGIQRNVLKGISICKTEYVMILGDDDFLSRKAFKVIFSDLEKKPDWIVYNHDRYFHKQKRFYSISNDISNFLNKCRSIDDVIFISDNIYKTDIIKKGITKAKQYHNCESPHLISMLFGALNFNSGIYILSDKNIFHSIGNNSNPNSSWNLYLAFVGMINLGNINFRNDINDNLSMLIRHSRSGWLSNTQLILSILLFRKNHSLLSTLRLQMFILKNLIRYDRYLIFVTFLMVLSSNFISLSIKNNFLYKFYKKTLYG